MDNKDEKSLFQLTPPECDEWIEKFFETANPTHPIKCSVAAALMVAEATTQRIALKMLERTNSTGQCNWPEFSALPEDIFEFVESLTEYMFNGPPTRLARIDLIVGAR